jgi:Asp/Glu/hydantoin racemase
MTRIVFVHTSPAAIGPIQQFYSAAAPDLDTTHLLEDGILRFFSALDYERAEERLQALLRVGSEVYDASAAVITCSAVPRETMVRLRKGCGIPVLKIDEPMAEAAVLAARRIAVLVTFAPTMQPTLQLLNSSATAAGQSVDILPYAVSGAYDALLGGRPDEHDRLLLDAAVRAAAGADALVLAQVSMTRAQKAIEDRVSVPVFSSLSTSLEAVRRSLAASQAGAV